MPTITVSLADWSRVECEVIKVTHHVDAGYKYSRVHYLHPAGGSSFVLVQGHFGPAPLHV